MEKNDDRTEVRIKPEWQKLPVVPRKKGKPRDGTTYRSYRREAAKEYRKMLRKAGKRP